VTVRVLASGICHSDLDVIDGRSPIPAPVILGHEAAGVVERIGDGVDSVDVGDEVMISSMTPCGDCPWCRADRPSRCPQAYGRPSFPFRWRGTEVRSYANVSSFATHVTVRAAQVISTTGIPPASSALIGCAVSTGWGAVTNVAQVAAGETVVVIGIGGIGVNAIAAARLAGASRIIAVDIDPRKEQVARFFGADDFVTDISTIGRADVVVECSGAPAAISGAAALAPTVALVGIPPSDYELRVNARSLVLGHRLLGSLNGDVVPARDLPRIVELIRSGALDVAAQVSLVWRLDEIHDAIAAVRAGDVIRATLDMR
jgi:S-(hydroxymethyl)glutathione dehydrogenase/alcohol dehydrogenase